MTDIENRVEARVDELRTLLKRKDDDIATLNQEVGKLKECCSYLTAETAELKGQIKQNEVLINNEHKSVKEIVQKTVDLEDRSRRNNLIFYNIPEEQNTREREQCEKKIYEELKKCGIQLNDQLHLVFDRAHRLGKPKKPSEHSARPRPVIARFTYYREKVDILKMRRNFKHSAVNISEDYSKDTLAVHKQLVAHAKEAQMKLNTIKSFNITYRRVTLRYEPPSQNPFFKSFNLKDIEDNNQWFLPN